MDKTLQGSLFVCTGTAETCMFLNRKNVQVIGLIKRRSKVFCLNGSTCKHLNRVWAVNAVKACTKLPDFDMSRTPVNSTACTCYKICTVPCKRSGCTGKVFIGWTIYLDQCNWVLQSVTEFARFRVNELHRQNIDRFNISLDPCKPAISTLS